MATALIGAQWYNTKILEEVQDEDFLEISLKGYISVCLWAAPLAILALLCGSHPSPGTLVQALVTGTLVTLWEVVNKMLIASNKAGAIATADCGSAVVEGIRGIALTPALVALAIQLFGLYLEVKKEAAKSKKVRPGAKKPWRLFGQRRRYR